jgi:hypothetical protein
MIWPRSSLLSVAVIALVWVGIAATQEQEPDSQTQVHDQGSHQHCPMTTAKQRADQGMGFDQAKTAHHFLLKPDGGIIRVEARDARDTGSRDRIRMHLAHIAKAFAAGDFDIPMFVHDQVPPGVPAMKAKKDVISYRFEPAETGGQVVITSRDPEAVSAVHEFLIFQIHEHKTGDKVPAP